MPQERTVTLDLAFRPSLVKKRFSQLREIGVDPDRAHQETLNLCERDLTYYFLEQFAKRKLVSYGYHFVTDEFGQKKLTSANYERFGDVCSLFANAIDERKQAGLSFDREEAELTGLIKIKQAFSENNEVTSLVLVSPPSFHGSYSFVYFGLYDPKTEEVEMYAWRNDSDLESHRQFLNEYAQEEIVGPEAHANDFLRNPVFKVGEEAAIAHGGLLKLAGAPPEDFYQYREVIHQAAKMLVDLIKDGADDPVLNLAQANVELEFIKIIEQEGKTKPAFDSSIIDFGDYEEAHRFVILKHQVMSERFNLSAYSFGGCGTSMFSAFGQGRGLSLSILGISVVPDLSRRIGDSENYFNCPKCQGKIEAGQGITACPHCGYTKEQAARDTGVSC